MQIGWQDDAIRDLVQIRRFITVDNPSAAEKVAGRVRNAVPQHANHPGTGRPRRVPGTRELALIDIPYRVEENSLVILRVLHTSRKWPEE